MVNRPSTGSASPSEVAGKRSAKATLKTLYRERPEASIEQVPWDLLTAEIGNIQLPPVVERIARDIYQRMGQILCPTYEAWKFVFLTGEDPCQQILYEETCVRAFERFMARHPDAKAFAVAATICFKPENFIAENSQAAMKEIENLIEAAWKQTWIPLTATPILFPTDEFLVLEYAEAIEEWDGMPFPNLRGKLDPRQVIHAADIVGDIDSTSEEFFCLYGSDQLDENGMVPAGPKAVFVRLDASDKTKDQLGKLAFVVKMIKGRYEQLPATEAE